MKIKSKKTYLALLLSLTLIVLAGCQSVSGLDLNKMFMNSAAVQSLEGIRTYQLELVPNNEVPITPDERAMFDLLSRVHITLSEMKQQDRTHMSAKGVIEYNKGKIPFQVVTSGTDYTISVEGAKKPVIIRNGFGTSSQIKDTMTKEMQDQLRQLSQKSAELTPSLIASIMGWAPNPMNISVSSAKKWVNAEEVGGHTIHAEIKGGELAGLIKGFLTNLMADEQGLKDILGQIYDLYVPILQQQTVQGGAQAGPLNDLAPYLSNKTLAVEFSFAFLKQYVKQTLDNYDQTVQQWENDLANGSAPFVPDDSQSMKIDMFVDGDLIPRTTDMEITIAVPDKNSALKSFKITSSSQVWNLGKPVVADTIDTSAGALDMDSFAKPGKIMPILDPNSQLYDVLKNGLHITKKEITMRMNDTYENSEASTRPYNRDGTVMVPIRFVVEQLDADVEWEQATRKVTVTDPVSGSVIGLNIGSKQASLNGIIKPLETEAELTNDTTFVPVRFVAESMGARVDWDQALQTVTITRD